MSPGTAPARRVRFCSVAVDQINCPYVYDGKGEQVKDPESGLLFRVFDCSGLGGFSLFEASNGLIDHRATWNANRYWTDLPAIDEADAKLGDACCYGHDGIAHHVAFLLAGGWVISASNGGPDVTSISIARQRGARVRAIPEGPHYRPDFLGIRSMSQFLSM